MEVFVARQPIFTKQKKVLGYELLYRSGTQNNFYDHVDGDRATSDVLTNSFSIIGIDVLTGGKQAFVNFTQNLLKREMVTIVPPKSIVVEILEDVVPDVEIIEACRKLKKMGYTLALDDFADFHQITPLVDLADIIKVDFLKSTPEFRRALPQLLGDGKIKFLAEKVETIADYQEALEHGYSYFQGYYFSKPEIFSGQDLAPYKLNYLRIIQEINRSAEDFDKIEAIVKQDVSLSYKLLRLINSAAFGLNTKISSIKYALVLLGIKEFVKWITLISLRGLGEDKPDELMVASLIRARFAELLAPKIGMKDASSDLFLMGMFSMIDALLDRPISEVMNELPISQDIKGALLGEDNAFRRVYELIVTYEQGRWQEFSFKTGGFHLDEPDIAKIYVDSLKWVRQIYA